ncbi:MAG TPA: AIR synthase-related protein, partial [Chitinophagales bacterium]|nr:AIR synthase-related protein [Chitinophagales bacterium]
VVEVNIQPGDVIVGLASFGKSSYEKEYNSGIGCNGLTSARHDVLGNEMLKKYPETFDPMMNNSLIYSGSKKITDMEKETGLPVGKLLLSPTRTFFPVIKKILQKNIPVHGIIHCTGGGQTKVLKFAERVRIIKDNLFEPPPIFKLIQNESGAPWKEMYEVFNMGHRMEIYTLEENADAIIDIASGFQINAKRVGYVEPNIRTELLIKGSFEKIRYQV